MIGIYQGAGGLHLDVRRLNELEMFIIPLNVKDLPFQHYWHYCGLKPCTGSIRWVLTHAPV
jgi:hypothetical protein